MAQDPGHLVAQLYAMHATSLHRYLLLTGQQPADADELLQEAFLRLFRLVRQGEQVDKPKAWLLRVLQNLRVDKARKEAGHTVFSLANAGSGMPEWTSPRESPEQVLLDQERFDSLRKAMGALTERQHQYLVLRSEGMTLREIAEIHGVAVQSVAEACARAIERLGRLTHE